MRKSRNQIKFCFWKTCVDMCIYIYLYIIICVYIIQSIHQQNRRSCGIYLQNQNQVTEKHPALTLIVRSWPASHWGTTKPWVQRRNPTDPRETGAQNLRSRTVSRRVPRWPNPRYQKRNKCSSDLPKKKQGEWISQGNFLVVLSGLFNVWFIYYKVL